MVIDVCDNREFESSHRRDNRDINFRVFRDNAAMKGPTPFQEWLSKKLLARGSKKALAEYLGIRQDGITRLLNWEDGKERKALDAKTLLRIRDYFDEDPPGYVRNRVDVSIVGCVDGPTDEIFFYEDNSNVLAAPTPPGSTNDTIAVEVKGDSVGGMAFDGDLIYFDRTEEKTPPDRSGRLYAIKLTDGRTLLRRVANVEEMWLLYSAKEQTPTIAKDVTWAAKVTWIKAN